MKDDMPDDRERASHDLDAITRQWLNDLPREFTMGNKPQSFGDVAPSLSRDLHFVADDVIPGLYYAKLDPTMRLNGNGNGNGHGKHLKIDFGDGPDRKK